MNQVDQNEILKQIDVYRLKMDINKYLIKIMNENLMDKLMKRTMRNIVNCWIISDSEYFSFVDKKWKDIVNYIDHIDRNNQHDFDEIVPDKKPPIQQRQNIDKQDKKENIGYIASFCNGLFCFQCKLRKIKMDPILKYEYRPNSNFENLKTAIKYLQHALTMDIGLLDTIIIVF